MTRARKTAILAGLALAPFSLARCALFFREPDQFAALTAARAARAFLAGLRFDLSAALLVLSAPVLLMNLPFAFAGKKRWFDAWAWVAFGLVAAFVAVLAADVCFFGYMGRHLADDVALLRDETTAGELRRHAAAAICAAAAVGLLALGWWRVLAAPLSEGRRSAAGFAAIGLFLALAIRGHPLGGLPLAVADAYRGTSVSEGNLRLNGLFTLLHGLAGSHGKGERRAMKPQTARAELARLGLGEDPDFPFRRAAPASDRRTNVVVLALEGWTARFVDCISGGSTGCTPEFDALARDGLLFRRFYAAGQDSFAGLQAALTGLPPLPGLSRASEDRIGRFRFTEIGALARRHGYGTLMIQTAGNQRFRFDAVAAALGFEGIFQADEIPLRLRYPAPKEAKCGWDYEILQYAKERLDAAREPFFAVVSTATTHEPFPDPGERFHRHPPGITHGKTAAYLDTLAYADWSLAEFLRAARKEPWFERTVFFFFGDHTVRNLRGVGAFDPSVPERYHVPLLVYAPGRIRPGVVDRVCSQLDLLPTIMEVLGLGEPFAAAGRSLFSGEHGWALAGDGSSLVLIGERGWVHHDLRNRLDAGVPDEDEARRLERLLFALDAAIYDAVYRDRWLGPK
jgi:phosphoglycerol transferase MdoB-like AlkP superfamily enzyme